MIEAGIDLKLLHSSSSTKLETSLSGCGNASDREEAHKLSQTR
jgi:hypothetical protein